MCKGIGLTMLTKIISGGQTGVDRGALDAALSAAFPCGGWCPEGRKAEDGPIPEGYPLQELPGADYLKRTRRNVADSDGTLVISFGESTGGTLATVRACQRLGKSLLVVDASRGNAQDVAAQAAEFVRVNSIKVLNVAGPRESKHAGAHDFAMQVVRKILTIDSAR
jgi:hypothetical protein